MEDLKRGIKLNLISSFNALRAAEFIAEDYISKKHKKNFTACIASAENDYHKAMAKIKTLSEQNEKLREGLEFIASGCLVPPDGGTPNFEDAIEAARNTLKETEGL
jgi:hypothetical protein